MLIIPKEPIKFPQHTAFAVSTNTFESIVIRQLKENVFQTALFKHFDLPPETGNKPEKQSAKWYPVAVFDSYEKCEQLIQAIIKAIEADQKVFRVSEYLDEHALKHGDLPEV